MNFHCIHAELRISPWNFPLAILLGKLLGHRNWQCHIKPAEQTPLIAREAVRILQEAGSWRSIAAITR